MMLLLLMLMLMFFQGVGCKMMTMTTMMRGRKSKFSKENACIASMYGEISRPLAKCYHCYHYWWHWILGILLLLLCRCNSFSLTFPIVITRGVSFYLIHRKRTFSKSSTFDSILHAKLCGVIHRRCCATTLHVSSSTTSKSRPSIIREEIRYIAGRRALLFHPTVPVTSSSSSSSSSSSTIADTRNNEITTKYAPHPPLVVLGGMAQSISNWEFHLSHLSQSLHRSVLMYEPLGQGPSPPLEYNIGTAPEQYYNDVTLWRQGEDFWKVINEAFFIPGSYYYDQHLLNDDNNASNNLPMIDVASFSFGGRVSMAAATLQPKRIRRMHLTGVGAGRDGLANILINCWKDLLLGDNDTINHDAMNHQTKCSSGLRSFAWSIILATYSENFLAAAGLDRIKTWVESVCQNNTEEGLRAILTQTHGDSESSTDHHLWTPAAMAQRIRATESIDKYKILVGSSDKIANPSQALHLAKLLRANGDDFGTDVIKDDLVRVVDGCGHSVPMEAMRLWREDVIQFLNG